MRFFKQLVLLCTVLVLAVSCGTDKNFGDGEGVTTGLALKTTLQQVMDKTSVLATSLRHQDDTPIEGVNVSLSLTLGALILFVDEANTNALGLAGNSVAKQVYDYRITNTLAGVGEIITSRSISIKGTSTDKFRASNITLNVTASELSSLQLDYFRVDNTGAALDFTRPVLRQTSSSIANNSDSQVAELFAGNYRVRVQGQSSTGSWVTQMSDTFSVVGAQEISLTNIVLDNSGNALSLSLLDNNAQAIQGRANGNVAANDVRVLFFDVVSSLELGRVPVDENGQASLQISSNVTDVMALIVDFSAASNQSLDADKDYPEVILGMYRNENFIADDTQILNQFLLTGQLQLATGEVLAATDSADIQINNNDIPAVFVNKLNTLASLQTAAGSADFSVVLFSGNYTVNASSVEGFPSVSEQIVDVLADTRVQISVVKGGLLSGVISDENNTPLSAVSVSAYAADSLNTRGAVAVAQMTTAADGVYRFDLAAGDYDLWVNGAVTENITVLAAQTVSQNIQRFTVSGSVTDINNSALNDMTAFIVNGDTTTVTTGTFNLHVFEGLNALCYRPSNAQLELGLECHLRVNVDQAAVNTL